MTEKFENAGKVELNFDLVRGEDETVVMVVGPMVDLARGSAAMVVLDHDFNGLIYLRGPDGYLAPAKMVEDQNVVKAEGRLRVVPMDPMATVKTYTVKDDAHAMWHERRSIDRRQCLGRRNTDWHGPSDGVHKDEKFPGGYEHP